MSTEMRHAGEALLHQYTDFSRGHGNVRLSLALAIGAGTTVFLLGIAFLARFFWGYYHELFFERGPIPYLLTFIFGFSIGILVQKFLWQRTEVEGYGRDYARQCANLGSARPEGDEEAAVLRLPGEDEDGSILASRLRKALSRHQKTGSVAAVDEILRATSEVDRELVESSYSLLSFLTWVLPILGFLGTVIGVGSAIGGFATVIDAADVGGFQAVRDNITVVTHNLALAFDTTLLALIYAALVMFFSALLKKRDEDFLSGVDQFCHDHVMGNLTAVDAAFPARPAIDRQPDMSRLVAGLEQALRQMGPGPNPEQLRALERMAQLMEHNQKIVEVGSRIDQLVQTNMQLVSEVPAAAESMKQEIARLGGLFSSIFNRPYGQVGE